MARKQCEWCEGDKELSMYEYNADTNSFYESHKITCPRCNGTGYEPTDKEKSVFKKPSPERCKKIAEVIKNKDNPDLKYRNLDKRCHYPFTPDPLNYCWGYAGLVDKKATKKEIAQFCKGCDYWKGGK